VTDRIAAGDRPISILKAFKIAANDIQKMIT
jgi:hypothetical protein